MKLEPWWIVGFVEGEGCFCVSIMNRTDMTYGAQIQPEFTVVQHEIDIQLLYALHTYFGCGSVGINHKGETVKGVYQGDRMHWRVKNLQLFLTVIIPFFEKYPLKGKRNVEFQKFRKICFLMRDKVHLKSQAGSDEVIALARSLRQRFK